MIVYDASIFFINLAGCLWQNIATINKHIAARHIGGSITCKVQVKTLDLLGVSLATESSHAVSLINGEWASTHLGIKKSRRDDVDTSEFTPLTSQRLSKVGDVGLGSVIYGLVSGHVDNVSTHAGCDDEVAESLLLEDLPGVLGAVYDAINWSSLAPAINFCEVKRAAYH